MESEKKSDAFEARQIVRRSSKAALATLDVKSGTPFVSLAAVATLVDGRPVTLISTLARHTQNLKENPAASLLFEVPAQTGGVMAGSRITLVGALKKCDANDIANDNENIKRRYLARHEEAADFVDFADFDFYRMDIQEGHFVAAFGRIRSIPGEKLWSISPTDIDFTQGESSVIAHMNADHLDAIQGYASEFGGSESGDWRMMDIDREGFSIVSSGRSERIIFPKTLQSYTDLRKTLAELAKIQENTRNRPQQCKLPYCNGRAYALVALALRASEERKRSNSTDIIYSSVKLYE